MINPVEDAAPYDNAQRAFIERLCAAFSTVKTIHDDFLDFYEGMLVYGFLNDVAIHAIALFLASDEDRDEAKRLLDFMESEYAAGPESVRDIIHLGFIENLGGPPQEGWRIRELLGPQLRRVIEEVWPSQDAT